MKLLSVRINNLFGQFDYIIELNQEEGITILTGPNGYGKTTILNIIWGLFNKDFEYIRDVPFKEINLNLDNGQALCIIKESGQVGIVTQNGDTLVTQNNERLTANITKLCFSLTDKNAVYDFFEFSGQKLENEQIPVLKFLASINVYFIKDQRLTQEIVPKHDGTFKFDGTIKANGAVVLVKTISLYSAKLIASIFEKKNEEQQLADKLASSQHNRIKALSSPLAESEFRERFNALRKRYRQLHNMGIYTVDLEDTDYKDNKGYLSVFLLDWEERIAVYDEPLAKIELFLSILNGKKLINKTVTVNAKDGFLFLTSDGKPLPLTALSSGEQHETILLYELLFNAPPNSLVLIDEPETSMHVAWQIEFLHDIESIAKTAGLSFIIATHSPDLINDKMDLCVDLFENARGNGNHGK
jgi:ABC-type lipoprotein export system ATPase subunit